MLKVHSIDEGFCKVNYVGYNDAGQKVYYCLLDNGYSGNINIIPHRSTDELEPNYPVKMKAPAREIFEIPEVTSRLTEACRDWIVNN